MIKYIVIAAVCLAVLGGVGFAVRAAMTEPKAAPAPIARPQVAAPKREVAPARIVVLEMNGVVEKRTGKTWSVLRTGDVLDAEDTVRTAVDASATIELAGQQVTLHGHTEITMGEISEKVNIVLTEGRLSAAGRQKTMRIEVRNSDAVAEAHDAAFNVMSSGQGDVTVAATSGAVDLSAAGKRVKVAAGEQSTALRGAAPTAPAKIPSSLFLKVSAAGGGAKKVATVQGETAVGAIVSINGVRTLVGTAGEFELEVPLKEGKNKLVVRVEDVAGRMESTEIAKNVDTKKPRLETEVDWE